MDKYYHCPYCIIRETGAEEGNLLKVTNMPEEQQGQYLHGAQQGFKSRYLQVLNTLSQGRDSAGQNFWESVVFNNPFKGSKHKIKGYPP